MKQYRAKKDASAHADICGHRPACVQEPFVHEQEAIRWREREANPSPAPHIPQLLWKSYSSLAGKGRPEAQRKKVVMADIYKKTGTYAD